MTNYREILRLHSLGLTHREIVDAAGCGRNTVTRTLARAREQKLDWQQAQSMSQQGVSQRLFPTEQKDPVYKMPDYDYVHKELQRSGVTLNLLWLEYCDQCRAAGEIPYQSTQFNKYYADYVHKTKATVHFSCCSRSLEDLIGNLIIGLLVIGFFEKLFLKLLQSFVNAISGFLLSTTDHLCDVLLELRLVG